MVGVSARFEGVMRHALSDFARRESVMQDMTYDFEPMDNISGELITLDGEVVEEEISFPGMSLEDFMARTKVYEQMPVPFSRSLRRSTYTAMVFMLIVGVGLIALPHLFQLSAVLNLPFLNMLNAWLFNYIDWLYAHIWLYVLDGVLLFAFPVLFLTTHWLRRGPIWLHWCAFGYVVLGVLFFIGILIPLLLLLVKVLVWIVAILLIVLVMIAILWALVRTPR